MADADEKSGWDEEQVEVWCRRYREALDAGFNVDEAATFARSTLDVGELRRLLEHGCDGRLAARILL